MAIDKTINGAIDGNGGFDIVIGNPPWGAVLSMDDKRILKNLYSEIDSSTPNSYAYFIGLAVRLCSSSISLVLPDSILIKDYSKSRLLMLPYLREIIWYENTGIPFELRMFKYVEHDVCILSLSKSGTDQVRRICHTYQPDSAILEEAISCDAKEKVFMKEFEYIYNMRISSQDVIILHKLIQHKPMKEFMQCHEGIHSGNVRDKLFFNYYKKGYKKLFYGGRAGDIIKSYYGQTSGWYVNYDDSIIDKEKGEYASLRDENIFTHPKIYITRTGNPFKAFYDEDTYASNNFFSLQYQDYSINNRENLMVMLALINSKLCQYYVRMFAAPRLGNTFIETKILHLLKFPIPEVLYNSRVQHQFLYAVSQIIALKKDNPDADTKNEEQLVDALVYKLYGLTYEEVLIVDSETPITEKEFNKTRLL